MNLRGTSGIVYGPRKENFPLPINDKRLSIILNFAMCQLETQRQQYAEQEPGGS